MIEQLNVRLNDTQQPLPTLKAYERRLNFIREFYKDYPVSSEFIESVLRENKVITKTPWD